jgi:exonuclease III
MVRRLSVFLAAPAIATALAVASLPASSEAVPVAAARPSVVTPAKASGLPLRVATFNVRTARALSDKRRWLQRVSDVSAEILSERPAVVLIQELGPGRADGKKSSIGSAPRQTTSLTDKLAAMGATSYALVRWSSYFPSGTSHGTQGARILYDKSQVTLLSDCPEKTGKKNYNRACAWDLPIAAGAPNSHRRSAAYAKFRIRGTERTFWTVSAHFENRKGAKYDAARLRSSDAVANKIASLNPSGLPVIFGGDINSWYTDPSRYAPQRRLVAHGYADTVDAPIRINHLYPTVNHWRPVLKKTKNGVRLDVIMVQGGKGATRWENQFQQNDSARPSDHNMVVADILL